MRRLLAFVYQYRAFIVFVFLEFISATLFLYPECYETSASVAIGSIQNAISNVKHHPFLKEENEKLLRENACLREELLQVEKSSDQVPIAAIYHFISARVINNSIVGTKNYLTLDKGSIHGIAPGMGVVSTEGIVGSVKAVSDRFATVTSLLHTSVQVSAKISTSKALGTVRWSGHSPCRAQMLYVPRHVSIALGDTVATSGYNATYLPNVAIGVIKQVRLRKEALFYDIELELSTKFSTLQYVCVVQNDLQKEKNALEQHTKDFYE